MKHVNTPWAKCRDF